MMRFQILVFIVGLLFSSSLNFKHHYPTNNENTEFKRWSKNNPLKWSDFQGNPDVNSTKFAVTRSHIKSEYILYTPTLIEFDIYAAFNKNMSWTKSNCEELLSHEQIHFDIAELNARLLRKNLESYKLKSLEVFNQDINNLFKDAQVKIKEMNQLYDEETKHGIIKEKQAEWQNKMDSLIRAYDNYSKARIVIRP